MKNKLFKFILIASFFFGLNFCFVNNVSAASVYASVPSMIKVGEVFQVVLYADVDNEAINSVDMTVTYDNSMVSFSGYKSENSMVKTWIDSPRTEGSNVVLTGIIPGGISGVYDARKSDVGDIPLVSLMFKAVKSGTSEFSFLKSVILKNDGNGTELVHEKKVNKIEVLSIKQNGVLVKKTDTSVSVENTIDTENPESFPVDFIKSSFFSRTPSMIAFNAMDSGSGIKEYEIKINDGEWKTVKSPYPVPKSLFSQILTVRATDFYGNSMEVSVNTSGFIDGNLRISISLIIAMLLLFSILVYKVSRRKVKNT